MAGNSSRKGAVRKDSNKRRTAGSGGRVRRGLAGKGPTPRAEDRVYHKAHKKKQQAASGGGKKSPPKRSAGSGAEWIAGRNAVVEALREGVPVSTVYVADGTERDNRVKEVFRSAADRGVGLSEVARGELDRLTGGAVHQGVAARVPAYEYAAPMSLVERAQEAGEAPLIVMLDQVTDPRNLGAIVRSAAAFGAHGVVIGERRTARMTAAAWKTSAGAAARTPVAQAGNLTRQLKEYQDAGCFVVGLAADGDLSLRELVADADLATDPLVVVVGAEGGGLSRLVRETCDRLVAVPMAAAVESLNAGVAASVVLYAISESRTTSP